MAKCASCAAEFVPGTRWCNLCRSNVADPAIGTLASPIRRLAAHMLDWGGPFLLIFLSAGAGGSGILSANAQNETGLIISAIIAFALQMGVLCYAVSALYLFSRGSTPGKKFLGLRVIMHDGNRAGFMTMLVREWVGKWISAFVFCLGFIWIIIDQENQGWHDRIMTTYVVRE